MLRSGFGYFPQDNLSPQIEVMVIIIMETNVYDMRSNLEEEYQRLEKSDISMEAKESTRGFLDSTGAKEVTMHQIYFYAV